jgi:hypothetical protein
VEAHIVSLATAHSKAEAVIVIATNPIGKKNNETGQNQTDKILIAPKHDASRNIFDLRNNK